MLYSINASNWRIIMKNGWFAVFKMRRELSKRNFDSRQPICVAVALHHKNWTAIDWFSRLLYWWRLNDAMTWGWCYVLWLWLCVSVLRLIADYYFGFLVILASYLLIRRRSVHKVHCFQLWKICTWRFFSLSLGGLSSNPKLGLRLFLVTLTKTSNSMSRKRCNKLIGVFLHSISGERDDLRKKRDTCE